jgi:glycosyltransferase involved in cell wall biosynthesis
MKKIGLKKCIVVTCFDQNQPGYLDFSYRIASLAKDYQLTIVSLHEITQSELIFKNISYKVFMVGLGKPGWVSYLIKSAMFIRQQKPDVVMLLHSAAAPIVLLIGNIPTCLYWNEHPTNLVHLPTKFAPIRRIVTLALYKILFTSARKASVVMPIGEEHRDDLCKHKVEPQKIVMLYMGVSDQFLLKQTTKEHDANQTVHLMYLGTVSKVRGRDVMLEAMSILAKKNVGVHLTIVGANQEQLDYCKERILELQIAGMVTVLGRVPGNRIPDYLIQADFGICLWEQNIWNEFNPPTKLFEYLVAGVPVLASNIRTHTRYVQDWKNGLIFDYDAHSLARVIIELDKNKNNIYAFKKHAAKSGKQFLWSKLEPTFLASMRTLATS